MVLIPFEIQNVPGFGKQKKMTSFCKKRNAGLKWFKVCQEALLHLRIFIISIPGVVEWCRCSGQEY